MFDKETTAAISIGRLKGTPTEREAKLKERGIYNSHQLLWAARTPSGRQALAEHAGVESRAILELANGQAWLVSGVSVEFSPTCWNRPAWTQ